MPTILRFRGFRIMIYVDDHDPAHVHAEGHGDRASFFLGTDSGEVALRGKTRLPKPQIAALTRFIEENRDMLVQAWEERHGSK